MVEAAVVSIGTSLLATGIAAGTSVGRSTVADLIRSRSVDRDLDDVATEFSQALRDALEDVDEELETGEFGDALEDWGAVARELYDLDAGETATATDVAAAGATERLAFEDETAAVDAIAEAIAAVNGVDLAGKGELERELKRAVTLAYRDAVDRFLDRIAGTDLADALLAEANIEALDRLSTVQDRLDELAARLESPRYYDWRAGDAAGRAETAAALVPHELPFVERPELAGHADTSRLLVVGPGGAGKSRALAALVEEYDREVAHVVRPHTAFTDQSHLARLREERFEGDVLLVWDDIHAVSPETGNDIVRKTVTQLEAALPPDASLHVLAAARTDRLEALPGDPRRERGGALWGAFETVALEPLDEETLAGVLRAALETFEVTATEAVARELLETARETDPSPLYVTSVVETAGGELTEADLEALPAETRGVWERQYRQLRDAGDDRVYVLWACALLRAVNLPLYDSLLRGVYAEVFDREVTEFVRWTDDLLARQWFVEVDAEDGDGPAGAVRYEMHAAKAAAVDVAVDRWVRDLSTFLQEDLEGYLPPDADELVRLCHSRFGKYLREASVPGADQLAERHLAAVAEQRRRGDPAAHNRYAIQLRNDMDRPEEAAKHYRRAIELDPEHAGAHYNYAILLRNDFDRPEDAAEHYRAAIEADPEHAKAHNNYAILLREDLERPREAARHYRRALEINPEYATAHNNYANLLKDELDRPEDAAEHYERALAVEPGYARARLNYATLLREGLDRPEDAVEQFEAAIEADPDRAAAYGQLAGLFRDALDRPQDAATWYERGIEAAPDHARLRYEYGVLLADHLDRPEDAVEQFEAAIEADPGYARAHDHYATLLATTLDRPEAALEHYRAAVEAAPDRARLRYNYAHCLAVHLDRPEDAAEQFEAALERNPDLARAHRSYARCLDQGLDRPAEAAEHYRRAIELEPAHAAAHHEYGVLLRDRAAGRSDGDADTDTEPSWGRDHLERAARLHRDAGRPVAALESLQALARATLLAGDTEGVAEAHELAVELLEGTDAGGRDDRLWFEGVRAVFGPGTADVTTLYELALRNIRVGNRDIATDLLAAVWRHREAEGDVEYPAMIPAAGLAHAALLERYDLTSEFSVGGIVAELDPGSVRPTTEPVHVWLTGGVPETTPETLRSRADRYEADDEAWAALEARAFATLLEWLQA